MVEADCNGSLTGVGASNFMDNKKFGNESYYNNWNAGDHEGTECYCEFVYQGDGTGVIINEYRIVGDNASGHSPFAISTESVYILSSQNAGAFVADAGDHWEATIPNGETWNAADPSGTYKVWLSTLDLSASSYNACEDYALPTWQFFLEENDTTSRPPSVLNEEVRECSSGATTLSQFRLGSFPGYWMGTFLFQSGNPDYVGSYLTQFHVTQWNNATAVTFKFGTQEVTATPNSPTVTFPPGSAWLGNVLLTGDDSVIGTATLGCPAAAPTTISRPQGYLFSMAEVYAALWLSPSPTAQQKQDSPPLVARLFDDATNPVNKWLSVELEGLHKREMIPVTPLSATLYRVDFVAEKFEIHGTVEVKPQSLLAHIESGRFKGLGGTWQYLPMNVDFEVQEYPDP